MTNELTAERLRDLVAGATPSEWDAKPVQPYSVENSTVTVDYDAKPEKWALWHRSRDDLDRRVHRPVADVHVVGQDWDAAEANAALIVALVNTAPQIIALIEREARMREALMDIARDRGGHMGEYHADCQQMARAALQLQGAASMTDTEQAKLVTGKSRDYATEQAKVERPHVGGWGAIMKLARRASMLAIEEQRQLKRIKDPLASCIMLYTDDPTAATLFMSEPDMAGICGASAIEGVCIIMGEKFPPASFEAERSDLELSRVAAMWFPARGEKCPRCRNFTRPADAETCKKCRAAIAAMETDDGSE